MAREFVMGARINLDSRGYSSGMADSIRATNRFTSEVVGLDRTIGRYQNSQQDINDAHRSFSSSVGEAERESNGFQGRIRGITTAIAALSATAGAAALSVGYFANEINQANGKFQAMTGATSTVSKEFTAAARSVYTQGWGDSIAMATDDMAVLKQQIEGFTAESGSQFLTSAYIMRDAFGAEVNETAKVVGNLTRQFKGLSETDALDMITTGFQRGANISDDFLDTINEYSVQFAGLGFSAEQMFGTMVAGSKSGSFMLDKVGDSVKESFIRMQDFSKTSLDAFSAIGLDGMEMSKKIAAGGDEANKAYQATLMALAKLDEGAREAQGVALFGTQWEDLGDSIIPTLQAGMKGLEGWEGATAKAGSSLHSDLISRLDVLRRSIMTSLGESMTPLMSSLTKPVNWAISKVPKMTESFGNFGGFLVSTFSPAIESVRQGMESVTNTFKVLSPYIAGVSASLLIYSGYLKMVALQTKIVTIATRVWNAVTKMSPIWLVAAAIGLLVGYLIHLAGGWGVVKQQLIAFLPVLQQLWSSIAAGVIPIFKRLWSVALTTFSNFKTVLLPVILNVINEIVAVFASLVGWIRTHWNAISTVVQVAWAAISAYISAGIDVAKTIITGGFQVIASVLKGTWEVIKGVVQVGWSLISGIIRTGLSILKGDWKGAWDNMLGMLKGVWSGIKDFFGGLKTLFFDSGKAIMQTLADGIKSMATAPFKAIKSALSKARELLPFSDAKTGPFSQLTHNGGKIMSTLAEGVYKKAGTLHNAMGNAFGAAPGLSASASVPAGNVNPAGKTVGSNNISRTTVLKIEKGAFQFTSTDGRSIEELGSSVMHYIYEKLKEADEIIGSDRSVLLDLGTY